MSPQPSRHSQDLPPGTRAVGTARNRHPSPVTTTLTALVALAALGLSACAGGTDPASGTVAEPQSTAPQSTTPQSGGATPHGYVEGASELSEPALSLLSVSEAGQVSLLTLTDLSSQDITTLDHADHVATDGRFLAAGLDGGGVALVDSGVWLVDHGDHQHYYRAPARSLATLTDLSGAPFITSGERLSVVGTGTTAVLLDRQELGAGTVSELSRTTIDEGSLAAPLGEGWVVVSGGTVSVLDQGGTPVAGLSQNCASPQGGTTTRVGVVLNCEGGAVLATVDATDGTAALERIDLPEGTDAAARPHSFNSRPGRPTVAALDDTGGYWLLDTRARTWSHVDSAPLVAVASVDDRRDRVVGMDSEGRLHIWSDGELATSTDPIASTRLGGGGLFVDATRAYVPAAGGDQVLEIDIADSARVARTIEAPGLRSFVEVGL